MSTSKNECIELKGNNEQVLKIIESNKDAENFSIKRKVGKSILYLLLKLTSVKNIVMTAPIARTLPAKAIDAIRKTGVAVRITGMRKRGRKRKYGSSVLRAARRGKNLKRISNERNVPLRTLYHYRKLHKS